MKPAGMAGEPGEGEVLHCLCPRLESSQTEHKHNQVTVWHNQHSNRVNLVYYQTAHTLCVAYLPIMSNRPDLSVVINNVWNEANTAAGR